MAGNENSGRRPGIQTILQDASMGQRLVTEQLHAAAGTFADHGRMLAAIHLAHEQQQRLIDDALGLARPWSPGEADRRAGERRQAAAA